MTRVPFCKDGLYFEIFFETGTESTGSGFVGSDHAFSLVGCTLIGALPCDALDACGRPAPALWRNLGGFIEGVSLERFFADFKSLR